MGSWSLAAGPWSCGRVAAAKGAIVSDGLPVTVAGTSAAAAAAAKGAIVSDGLPVTVAGASAAAAAAAKGAIVSDGLPVTAAGASAAAAAAAKGAIVSDGLPVTAAGASAAAAPARMRSAVGVEHSTPNTRASGCIVPQATVHCGLEVGRLTGRLASSVPPRHVRRRVSRRPRNGVLVMAHEPLTRSGGPRYVKEHRGVLVVALQSVAFGASPRRVPAGEAV